MSQQEPTHSPYSFGRDRYHDQTQQSAADQPAVRRPGDYGRGGGVAPPQGYPVGGGAVPPPPAGHRGLVTVVLLYLVLGFMVLWTGASAAVTITAVGDSDGEQVMVGLFMTVASLGIAAGLGGWLIRIHRRRATYRRILDQHYEQRFGHHPDHG